MEAVLKAYEEGDVDIKDKVTFIFNNKPITTIVGRVILNDILPEGMRFVDKTFRKKDLKQLLDDLYENFGRQTTVEVADKLKEFGFKYATKSAVTMNAYDFIIPEEKKKLIEEGNEKVKKIHDAWYKGLITAEEKHNQIIAVWTDIKARIEEALKKYYGEGNDLFAMLDSGAK
jgi:DNA-directed RNA polymerase subunit beta'